MKRLAEAFTFKEIRRGFPGQRQLEWPAVIVSKAALTFFDTNLQVIDTARVHETLPVTPAMGVGLNDHVWSLEEIVRLIDWNV